MESKPVKQGGRYPLKYRGTECLNCGQPLDLSDRYCPYCSQANTTKHLSVKDFFEEFLAEIVNLDTRLFRTLYTMVWRPGKISLDFISGKRKSYANPFRLLLSVAIIYFLMLTFSADFDRFDRQGRSASDNVDQVLNWDLNFDTDDPDQQSAIAALDTLDLKGLKNLKNLDSPGIKGLDSLDLKELDSMGLTGIDSLGLTGSLKAKKRNRDSLILADPRGYLEKIDEKSWLSGTLKRAAFFVTLINQDSVYTFEEAAEKYKLENSSENQLAFGIADSYDHLNRQPGTFLKEFISTVPFAIFFFLPLFTIFLWLFYIRKKYTYTDNLVFSFHSQAFFFILLIVSFLIDWAFGVTSIWVALLIFPVYLFLSMRRFYGQGWFKTTIKFLFLNNLFFILASIAAIVFLIGSALTF
ncbi:DUF3667 domain-containing protein [Robiginitalea aurantiaca]|uniref:DUF3667 domain-containing protein n=1 Tax=Robiginitalea aurantiaca TaxID=3056915 RepID=A0ABT7WIW0_9FLAO|nr:DUF3667 domain-containing protein [Robiginitalea aurantiaca]MDM9632754.1 DUF3667 domain-containing protein [Robiginitalea aurantiaca]